MSRYATILLNIFYVPKIIPERKKYLTNASHTLKQSANINSISLFLIGLFTFLYLYMD